MTDNNQTWDIEIKPQRHLLDLRLGELFAYRDLLEMFIRRDIVTVYKQTVLGPIWYFTQPLLMMFMFIIVFSNIANIPTDDVPPAIFYLAGIIIWNYFSDCLLQTSDVFFQNNAIFEKVYFPRVLVPIARIISTFIKFIIQSLLFVAVYFYLLVNDANIVINQWILLLPFYLLIMAFMGLGMGLAVSAMTAKYRDLKFLVSFGVQFMMYLSPVIYPVSTLSETYVKLMFWNPLSHVLEGFRFSILGAGQLNLYGLLYALVISITMVFTGLLLFNKTEQDYVDTI